MKFSAVVVLVVLQLILPLVANAANGDAKIPQLDAQVTDNSKVDANLDNIASTRTTIDEINSVNRVGQEDLLNKETNNDLINAIEYGSEKNVEDGSNLDEFKDLKNKIADIFSRLILNAPGDNARLINAPDFSFGRMNGDDINMNLALLVNHEIEPSADQIKYIQFDVPTSAEVTVVDVGKAKTP